jgi:tRNA pseudouridine13 synthase
MFGYRMIEPEGRPADIERGVLEGAGLELESFKRPAGLKSKGERRPLRVPVADAGVTEEAGDLWLTFALPPGSYATVLLDEIMKRS